MGFVFSQGLIVRMNESEVIGAAVANAMAPLILQLSALISRVEGMFSKFDTLEKRVAKLEAQDKWMPGMDETEKSNSDLADNEDRSRRDCIVLHGLNRCPPGFLEQEICLFTWEALGIKITPDDLKRTHYLKGTAGGVITRFYSWKLKELILEQATERYKSGASKVEVKNSFSARTKVARGKLYPTLNRLRDDARAKGKPMPKLVVGKIYDGSSTYAYHHLRDCVTVTDRNRKVEFRPCEEGEWKRRLPTGRQLALPPRQAKDATEQAAPRTGANAVPLKLVASPKATVRVNHVSTENPPRQEEGISTPKRTREHSGGDEEQKAKASRVTENAVTLPFSPAERKKVPPPPQWLEQRPGRKSRPVLSKSRSQSVGSKRKEVNGQRSVADFFPPSTQEREPSPSPANIEMVSDDDLTPFVSPQASGLEVQEREDQSECDKN